MGLIALPVAVGVYGVHAGMHRQTEEEKRPSDSEASKHVDQTNKQQDSPETKASTIETTPLNNDSPKDQTFEPMRDNLILPPLKF